MARSNTSPFARAQAHCTHQFPSRLTALLLVAVAASSCVSLEYELSSVPLPISAKPATAAGS